MNKLTIIGNLTRDPESRTTENEKTVCNFTVAVNRRRTQQNQQPEADFFRVAAWGKLGESCQKFLTKGRKVCVVGPVSVIYMQGQYSQKAKDYHYERTRTLLLDITSEVDFSFLKRPGFKYELDKIIKHYSETFFTDINVFFH